MTALEPERSVIAFDTETARFRPGVMAPELACLTWQIYTPSTGRKSEPFICHHTEAREEFQAWLGGPYKIVGHNVAYDLAVLGAAWPDLVPAIFALFDANRVECTLARQHILDIAGGCYRGRMGSGGKWIPYDYSLLALAKRHTGRTLEKDEWRLKYGELRLLPLEEWPEGARTYPLEDARATLDVWIAQEAHVSWLADQHRQVYSDFCLHLASCWGLRTDGKAVAELKERTEKVRDEVFDRLVAAGLVRKDGTRDTKAAKAHMLSVCEREALEVRRTPTGEPTLDDDACKRTGDETLIDYAMYSTMGTVLSKDVPMLEAGTVWPVHTRFGRAESGRRTSSGPNVQNPRRLPGVREAFRPRAGYVFIDCDFDQLELRTLAQCCVTLVGASELARVLNSGRDPHTEVASVILGISYEEAIARLKAEKAVTVPEGITKEEEARLKPTDYARGTAKVANFGFPGGLGAEKLVKFAWATYKVKMTEDDARRLKQSWLARWPEMVRYFDLVSKLCDNEEKRGTVAQLFSGRTRGAVHYTAACNTLFQGLGADAAMAAFRAVSRACYVEQGSPLYGSRPVNFVHDQIITETLEGPFMHDAAEEQARLMVKAANEWLPDVPAKTEPHLMRLWSKGAQRVFGSDGRLIPWPDKAEDAPKLSTEPTAPANPEEIEL